MATQMKNVDTKYHVFIKPCNHSKRKYKVNLPDMEQSHELILNKQMGLRKWCNKIYNLIVQANGIEDEPLIGCTENVKTLHYNSCFDFDEKIEEHPNDVGFILELLNAVTGFEVNNPATRDARCFYDKTFHYLHTSKHLPFLAYIYKTSIICDKGYSEHKQPYTTTYSWYHLEQNNINNYSIVGFAPPSLGVPCIILFNNHFQYITTNKIKNQVLKNPLGKQGDPLL